MHAGMMSRRRWLQGALSLTGLAIISGLLGGCAGGRARGASDENVTRLEIGTDLNLLVFDTIELHAPAGVAVQLTFYNRSHHHQHNWVLVNGGDAEATQVYDAAMVAGAENDWLPSASAQILAYTPLLHSGTETTVYFQAPTRLGSYVYLCTFPGHFLAGMRGTLTIT
jgi:azurin